MTPGYLEAVARAAAILFEAMSDDLRQLISSGAALWEIPVRDIGRRVARELAQRTVSMLARGLVDRAAERGFTVERSPMIEFLSVFGLLTVKSP